MIKLSGAAIAIVLLILVITIHIGVVNSTEKELHAWATARGEVVQKIELRVFSIGPYWYIKNARYYYIKTDKNVYWVKYVFGRTIKRELSNGSYETIED